MEILHARPAAIGDAADIARVHVQSWREAYASLFPDDVLAALDVDERRAMWTSTLSDTEGRLGTAVFVVEQAGRVVGFAACGDQRSPELVSAGFDGEIGAIYILKGAQGLGAGRLLMKMSVTALVSRGKKALSLWVLAENSHARAFYQRLGGELSAERSIQMAHITVTEVAYGWSNPSWLTR